MAPDNFVVAASYRAGQHRARSMSFKQGKDLSLEYVEMIKIHSKALLPASFDLFPEQYREVSGESTVGLIERSQMVGDNKRPVIKPGKKFV